jgi:metal-dependent amidase/aminoacylase/carboxypeptidase family protein
MPVFLRKKGINAIMIAAEAMTKFPFGKLGDKETANIGIINGGSGTNVVCDKVFLHGEVRSGTKEKGETMISKIIAKISDKFVKSMAVSLRQNILGILCRMKYTVKICHLNILRKLHPL